MPIIDAEGPISLAVENFRDLLKLCPTWQAWTESTGSDAEKQATAKESIYPVDLPPPEAGVDRVYTSAELIQMRPWCIVDTYEHGEGFRFRKIAESEFWESGTLAVWFEDDVAEADLADPASAKRRFINRVGKVLGELVALSGDNGRLNVTDVSLEFGPTRTDEAQVKTFGDRWIAGVAVKYGV